MVSAKKEMVTAMYPTSISTLLYFLCVAAWWVTTGSERYAWHLYASRLQTTNPGVFELFVQLIDTKNRRLFHVCAMLKCFSLLCVVFSIKRISGQIRKDEKLYPENFTRILDRLLDGYDNRLRPGFGGTCQNHPNIWPKIKRMLLLKLLAQSELSKCCVFTQVACCLPSVVCLVRVGVLWGEMEVYANSKCPFAAHFISLLSVYLFDRWCLVV